MIGGNKRIDKVTHSREVSRLVLLCKDGLSWVGRPQKQTVWLCTPLRSPSQDYVLGPLLLHNGQTEEGGARIQGVTQMRPHLVAKTSGRRSVLDPSGGAFAHAPR